VHVRRGDIVLGKLPHQVEEKRLVSFGVYRDILQQLLAVRAAAAAGATTSNATAATAAATAATAATAAATAKGATNVTANASASASVLLPLRIFFLCEGSRDSQSLLEYRQTELHKTYFVNVQQELAGVCNRSNACSAEVLHQATLLQSFAAMCESDVLITGTSGFSFVAAALCEPRMTIAVPLYNNFDSIR
jgi:hypothetical protein